MATIRCKSDDVGIGEKYVELAGSIISEIGSRSIRRLTMVAMMRHGYFIVSADLRKTCPPIKLTKCGELKAREGGVLFRLDPSREDLLPSIVNMLREEYGSDCVREDSRYEVLVDRANADDLREMAVTSPDGSRMDNAASILHLILPEGFRITKTMMSQNRLTIMCSQWPFKKTWIEKMNRLHRRR